MLRISRIFGIVLATAIACFAIIYFSIPMSDTQQNQFDVILVLGNPANDDGSIAPVARSRVLEAIRQYRAGVAPRLLLTGGAVKNHFVEAQVMTQFARSQGVPASATFYRRPIAEHHPERVLLVPHHAGARLDTRRWLSARPAICAAPA